MSKLHILNGRDERRPLIEKEMKEQRITNYRLWEGVHDKNSVVRSISLGHRMIVEYAKARGFKEVTIAEDDCRFLGKGAWEYYLNNKPKDFDLYLSCVYLGDIKPDNTVDSFCGLILYTISERFFDTFLSVDGDIHLDRALSGKGKFCVCNPFAAIQHDNIFSSNSGKVEDYSWQLRNYQLYNGKS